MHKTDLALPLVLRISCKVNTLVWDLPVLRGESREEAAAYKKALQHRSNTLVIASSLAKKCPDTDMSVFLTSACVVPLEMEPFCARKNNKYGVYFVDTHCLSKMKDASLNVVVVDLGPAALSGVVSSDDLYLQVIQFTIYVTIRSFQTLKALIALFMSKD